MILAFQKFVISPKRETSLYCSLSDKRTASKHALSRRRQSRIELTKSSTDRGARLCVLDGASSERYQLLGSPSCGSHETDPIASKRSKFVTIAYHVRRMVVKHHVGRQVAEPLLKHSNVGIQLPEVAARPWWRSNNEWG